MREIWGRSKDRDRLLTNPHYMAWDEWWGKGNKQDFPSTLEAKDQSILPARFRPELHHCPEEQVGYLRRHLLPEDGLPRQPCIYVAETRG